MLVSFDGIVTNPPFVLMQRKLAQSVKQTFTCSAAKVSFVLFLSFKQLFIDVHCYQLCQAEELL